MPETRIVPNGFFITLEGPEGGGKTVLSKRLSAALKEDGYVVLLTREPGGTPLGDQIRSLLVDFASQPPCSRSEALLFQASRAQLVEMALRPFLANGGIVICDRYADSTLAYQGYGNGENLDWLRNLVNFATGGLKPGLTLLLDLPVDVGLTRRMNSGELNRIDSKELAYHQRVRQGYLELAALEPNRWAIVDASQDEQAVFDAGLRIIRERIRAAAARA